MKHTARLFTVLGLLACQSLSSRASAQPVPSTPGAGLAEGEKNRKLRIQLDRTTIKAFEPVYVCLTAEQFATANDPEVYVSRGAGTARKVEIPKTGWFKVQIQGAARLTLQRRGAIVQAVDHGGDRTFLFDTPGEYKILVKIGPDSTTLALTVTDPEPGEGEAWKALGKRAEEVLQNNFGDQPEQLLLDTCGRVVRRYPRTACSAYCVSYVTIAKFKIIFEKHARNGGKPIYGEIAGDLERLARSFAESFYGEQMAFYAGYAKGLAQDYEGVIGVTSGMKTHFTQWGDGVTEMRAEVLAHLAPHVVIIDPEHPTTNPATMPVIVPVPRP